MLRKTVHLACLAAASAWLLAGCAATQENAAVKTPTRKVVARISVRDQMLDLAVDGQSIARFPVSTSKYGLGDQRNSYRTPLGTLAVEQKIGNGVPKGGKFYRRSFTGQVFDLANYDPVLHPAEYDSILTRIIWLRGLESRNKNAYERGIYIHGTNQEHLVGQPVSYGCIRMKNDDVLKLYQVLPIGAQVVIQVASLPPLYPSWDDDEPPFASRRHASLNGRPLGGNSRLY